MLILFTGLVIAGIALLPDVSTYPLPPQFLASITVVLAYVFTWSTFFWFLQAWFYILTLTMGVEIAIWTARKVMWLISFGARILS